MAIVFALLVIGVFKVILLYQVYHLHTLAELKRRARSGDERSASIYKVTALQPAVDSLLWLSGIGCASAVIIWAGRREWWAAVILVIVFSWRMFWAPRLADDGWVWKISAFSSRYMFKFINPLKSFLDAVAILMPATRQRQTHNDIYEKDDLLDLLDKQNQLVDNRVDDADLKIARGALSFSGKYVRDIMIPRSKARFVIEDENIGPMLMDELHKTGQTRFAVAKEIKKNAEPEVVGTLFLADLIGREDEGPVSRLIKKGVHYINEADNLDDALDCFIKTRAPLLVVVNNFEEVSGVLSLDDILSQILGRKIESDFSDYHDLKAVAGRSDKKG